MAFLKKIPTATIVLILFAVAFAIWGNYQMTLNKEYQNISIVDIGNGVVSDENEGKNVCVTGKLKIVGQPTDDQTLFKANSIALIRSVEMYQYYISNDEVCMDFRSDQEYDIKGKKGEKYVNPSFPDGVKNKIFFSKAKIGDIVIGEEFLNEIIESKIKAIDDSTERTVERKYLDNISLVDYVACDDGYFIYGNPDEHEIGDIRVRFEYVDMDSLGELTICGCQKKGKLVASEDSYNNVFYSTSLDEVENYVSDNDYKSNATMLFINAGTMAFIGILIYMISRARKSKKEA